ncbi:hypothetical protein RF11_01848 [Thelohanellus kitauei]|uniref:Uncharacterized protein n=1 Tax=Thelohanellus kitauei TaxID=669202 RepID=A0A0C2MNC2_THEKT|nr:hypothetical protein RF11_01848 [Thelohanellus kitauei]
MKKPFSPLKTISADENAERWIANFKLLAKEGNWDEPRQSVIMPTYFDEELMGKYLETEAYTMPPSEDKLKKIILFLCSNYNSRQRAAAAVSTIGAMGLDSGVTINDETGEHLKILPGSKPDIVDTYMKSFAIQSIMNPVPIHSAPEKNFSDQPTPGEHQENICALLSSSVPLSEPTDISEAEKYIKKDEEEDEETINSSINQTILSDSRVKKKTRRKGAEKESIRRSERIKANSMVKSPCYYTPSKRGRKCNNKSS